VIENGDGGQHRRVDLAFLQQRQGTAVGPRLEQRRPGDERDLHVPTLKRLPVKTQGTARGVAVHAREMLGA
jgi:hypothetical protein